MMRPAMPLPGDFVAEVLDQSATGLSEHAAVVQMERTPELRDRFGQRSRESLSADTRTRLSFLADAVALGEPALFTAQIAWTRAALAARHVPLDHLRDNLSILCELMRDRLPAGVADSAVEIVAGAIGMLDAPAHIAPSVIEGDTPFHRLARSYLLAMLEGDRAGACSLLAAAIRSGTDVRDIYERVIQPAHVEIGRMWHLGELSVAEEHYATAGAEWVLPQLAQIAPRAAPVHRTLVSTTADGDSHALGLRMVTDCFEFAGWRTYFLGASTPAPDLVQAVYDQKADLLALSASIGCHIRTLRSMIARLRAEPEVRDIPVIVGGEPFNVVPNLWRKVGADGSARSATEAVALGNRLVDHRS